MLTIRNVRIKELINRQFHFLVVHRRIHVKLLIDGLEFGMESTYDEVLEAVGLNHSPSCQFAGRNYLMIAGTLVAGVRIDTRSTDSRHQFVKLTGYRYFGILIRE